MQLKKVFFAVNSTQTILPYKRPIIFTESSFAGSGKYGAVALTDMQRDWSSLRNTIAMAMGFSMYGISNLASDACGSLGSLDEELCGRWAQLSALLPLVRNYYNITYMTKTGLKDNFGSEFYNIENYTSEFMTSSALNQRLPLTRYIYT
jgi:alpha-glucosidase (family GH31 glycosyl hydrolase)